MIQPRVSVLLPTYNRASFLPGALDAIAAQTMGDWELVVVDDGSTDGTEAVVQAFRVGVPQRVTYVRQANAGAYGARNTALDHAVGDLVAFYDSDDLWLPHHLANCVRALEATPKLDWVYAACRIVNHQTGAVIDPDTFRLAGAPRPFMALRSSAQNGVRVIDDDRAVACAFRDGLYCGLQNSVMRRAIFDDGRFHWESRNEAEDQLFVIRTLKRGRRLGYIDSVHVQYHVHGTNSSAPDATQSADRQLRVYKPLVEGFEALRHEFSWSGEERRELSRRIAQDHFWHIGYGILWKAGRTAEALQAYRKGLTAWPWSLACWKTYGLAWLRVATDRAPSESRTSR